MPGFPGMMLLQIDAVPVPVHGHDMVVVPHPVGKPIPHFPA